MTTQLESLYTAFTDAKIPYAYNVFPTDDTAPALPYVTAFVTGGQGFTADDENFFDTMDISVCLFTKTKDPATEDTVRGILKGLGLTYSWDETYATDEQMYVITYSINMEA